MTFLDTHFLIMPQCVVGFTMRLVVLCLVSGFAFGQHADKAKILLTKLFTTDGYNKLVRPSSDLSIPTILYVDMQLVSINDIDEVKEKMTTNVMLELGWMDTYLQWNPIFYNDIEYLYIPQSDIWKPDIALENGYTKIKELGYSNHLTTVDYQGIVFWNPSEVFETKCSIDIEYFPFDKQVCSIELGVWTSRLSDIDVEVGTSGILLDEYQENGEWEITKTSAIATQTKADGALVKFTIEVQRKPSYILYNMVLPVLLLSFLATFTFVLPVECGEKMGFCMTVYLAFAVFLTIVSGQLPASSSQSLLSKYLVFLVTMGTLIIMISVVEVRINGRRTANHAIAGWAKVLVRLSRRIQCRRSTGKVCVNSRDNKPASPLDKKGVNQDTFDGQTDTPYGDHSHPTREPEVPEEIQWADVVSAFDFYFFWLFLATNTIGTIVLLMRGINQP